MAGSKRFLLTALLAFVGLPHMEHMLVFAGRSATFWQDWQATFQRVILAQVLEWLPVGITGGAIVGIISGSLALRHSKNKKSAIITT